MQTPEKTDTSASTIATKKQLAAILQVSEKSIEARGPAIPSFRVGRLIRYDVPRVLAALAQPVGAVL